MYLQTINLKTIRLINQLMCALKQASLIVLSLHTKHPGLNNRLIILLYAYVINRLYVYKYFNIL